jgi:hypothetical protein
VTHRTVISTYKLSYDILVWHVTLHNVTYTKGPASVLLILLQAKWPNTKKYANCITTTNTLFLYIMAINSTSWYYLKKSTQPGQDSGNNWQWQMEYRGTHSTKQYNIHQSHRKEIFKKTTQSINSWLTGLTTNESWFDSRKGGQKSSLQHIQTSSKANLDSYSRHFFFSSLWMLISRSVKVTTHLHLVSRLRTRAALSLFPHTPFTSRTGAILNIYGYYWAIISPIKHCGYCVQTDFSNAKLVRTARLWFQPPSVNSVTMWFQPPSVNSLTICGFNHLQSTA